MLYVLLIIIALLVWVVAELRSSRRSVRLFVGGVAIVVVAASCLSAGLLSSQFSKTLQTNNVAKNLTSGIVEITSKPYNVDEFHERVRQLDDGIKPTYEDHFSAENAIRKFLSQYGIEYQAEMPIPVDNQYQPTSVK